MEEIMVELRISCSHTMLNYQLSKKFKLLGYDKFNHLTNTSNKEYYVIVEYLLKL